MNRTLLVTNDFPPVVGGIQSYLDDYTKRLDPTSLVVLASTPPEGMQVAKEYDATLPYKVVRVDTTMLLPTANVRRRMQELIKSENIDIVWFGAAAPLGLMAKAAKEAGAKRVVATTHGHEIGWGKIPGARWALRTIFKHSDVVTYISNYTLERLRPHLASHNQLVQLPSGIDPARFEPGNELTPMLRQRYRLGQNPTVVCISRLVPRKGQDTLIKVWPRVVSAVPQARLVIVGKGPYAQDLAKARQRSSACQAITLTGQIPYEELSAHVDMADVFAMPCRTRWGGLDVEGLGIVYLEASACSKPVIAGDSGGAPETVIEGETGYVVGGRDEDALTNRIVELLSSPQLRERMGAAGRRYMQQQWTWPHLVERLEQALTLS